MMATQQSLGRLFPLDVATSPSAATASGVGETRDDGCCQRRFDRRAGGGVCTS